MQACISDLPNECIAGKDVFVRVEFNVPLTQNYLTGTTEVLNDSRIRSSIPTILSLKERGARSIGLFAHLGRPRGKFDSKLSLVTLIPCLNRLLDVQVEFVPDCIGQIVQDALDRVNQCGKVFLFENLRFHIGEEENDEMFSAALALPFQLYVNDAFGASHRLHSSICGITKFLTDKVCGFTMQKEILYLQSLANPVRPFAAVIGGSKISTKLNILYNLMHFVDKVLIGGAMVFTFYKMLGYNIGNCVYDESSLASAESIIRYAEKKNVKLILAPDIRIMQADSISDIIRIKREVLLSESIKYGEEETKEEKQPRTESYSPSGPIRISSIEQPVTQSPVSTPPHPYRMMSTFESKNAFTSLISTVSMNQIPTDHMGVDIGNETLSVFFKELEDCKTIIWNGSLGINEIDEFANGTNHMIDYLASMTSKHVTTIICGGDTVAAIENRGLLTFTHISTGGAATLEYLQGDSLPGIEVLNRRDMYRSYEMSKPLSPLNIPTSSSSTKMSTEEDKSTISSKQI